MSDRSRPGTSIRTTASLAAVAIFLAGCSSSSSLAPAIGSNLSQARVYGSQTVLAHRRSAPPLARLVNETVLYAFGGGSDGSDPQADLTNVGGVLYGTTYGGGGYTCFSTTCGTIFKVTTAGNETVLHRFTGGSDGAGPLGSLTNLGGMLYGTNSSGLSASGNGQVFKISKTGGFTELHTFGGDPDGANPQAGLIKVGGALYGTTLFGGDGCASPGCGSFFSISPSGQEHVLYSFEGGPDGANPYANLTDVKGTLYGTTDRGGSSGDGTVYQITTSGHETVIYTFPGGADGANPQAALTNVNGALFGTASAGGNDGAGVVFSISRSHVFSVLYSFKGEPDGAEPEAGLTNIGGALYGTTALGGANGLGTVFKITKDGTYTQLYSFAGGSDGAMPMSGLTEVDGTLYGTTSAGGGTGCGGAGCGTIFSLSL